MDKSFSALRNVKHSFVDDAGLDSLTQDSSRVKKATKKCQFSWFEPKSQILCHACLLSNLNVIDVRDRIVHDRERETKRKSVENVKSASERSNAGFKFDD